MISNLFVLASFHEMLPLIIALGILVIPTVILLFVVVVRLIIKHIKRNRKPKLSNEEIKNKFFAPIGEDNIVSVNVVMRRVTIEVKNLNKVDFDGLRALGVGVMVTGNVLKCSSEEFANSLSDKA